MLTRRTFLKSCAAVAVAIAVPAVAHESSRHDELMDIIIKAAADMDSNAKLASGARMGFYDGFTLYEQKPDGDIVRMNEYRDFIESELNRVTGVMEFQIGEQDPGVVLLRNFVRQSSLFQAQGTGPWSALESNN